MLIIFGCAPQNSVDENSPLEFDTVFSADSLKLHLETYQLSDGWGYKISVDGQKLINQKVIPAINGNNRFKTSQDAYKVGYLVIKKLANGSTLPSVTVSELINLGIIEKQ